MKLQAISDGLLRRPCGAVRTMADSFFGPGGEQATGGTTSPWKDRRHAAQRRCLTPLLRAQQHGVVRQPQKTPDGVAHPLNEHGIAGEPEDFRVIAASARASSKGHGANALRSSDCLSSRRPTTRRDTLPRRRAQYALGRHACAPCCDTTSPAFAWCRSTPVLSSTFLYHASRQREHKRPTSGPLRFTAQACSTDPWTHLAKYRCVINCHSR